MEFKYSRIFLLGFGFFGISIIWALYNAYVPIFLQDTFHLSKTVTGFIMTIDNLFAVLLLPFLGALSDMTRTRLGRRKPYILLGAPSAAIMFALIPVSRMYENLALFMGTIVFMNFFMALFRSPVVAFMPDITPSEKRSQANGIINFMGGLGALLAYFGGKVLYDMNYAYPFYFGAAIMLLANLLVVLFVPEPEEYRVPGKKVSIRKLLSETSHKSFGELKENLKDVFASHERSLLAILLAISLWFIAFNSLETFFTSYAKYYLGIEESTGAFMLGLFSLSFMIFAIPAGFIGARLGRRRTITLGLMVIVAILIAAYLVGEGQKPESSSLGDPVVMTFMGLFFVGGMGWAMVNVNSLPMVVDMTTEEKLGGYTGLYYFFSQAANLVAPPLAGAFLDLIGYRTLIPFSIAFFILSAIAMQFVRRGDIVQRRGDILDYVPDMD
ncbi:SLC45 family MFS transporter [Thermococcus thioreducens]|uniref:Na+/melibiose symporter n=1 Tax=Thermococcus thioreducens TaxID=277988 RepID=A0A0Q2MSQ3_9EURY|nr:SLC45 family MFS transporter [Thermococcus thioreducens]ASJ12010.1 sucrose transporter [Thermococcus thioreducens]KQH82767.1 sucrose transporter [Thermococcus thioreducens]SEW10084.1 Na+/melibiose symporter [Thermococcus thioreducens]